MKKFNNRGYSAIVSVFLVTTIGMIMATSMSSVMIAREKIIRSVVNSAQSYYTAEAGVEDMMLRVIDGTMNYDDNEHLTLAGSTASTTVSQSGNELTILGGGTKNNYTRDVRVNLTAATDGASFNYGVQIGDGGLEMKNSGTIVGNVYSNGDLIGTNSAQITGDAWAAGNHKIEGFDIGGDAHAHTLKNDDIAGDAYYVTKTGTTVNGTSHPGSADPPATTMPISNDQINDWKADAEAGGTITGNQTITSGLTLLGPMKIVGNLTIGSSAVVTLNGTVWVTGDIILQNDAVLQLNTGYGTNSGLVIADGSITLQNNFIVCGSEGYVVGSNPRVCDTSVGSYVMLISTKDPSGDEAISMKNNSYLNGILYAPNGELEIENNANLKEATAYKIEVENNVVITYETGLVNLNFSSGPGGGWVIGNWQEVE